MTIAQLKRHMDRRFDRLERTKADRKDLRRYATKRDLQRFATKRDLAALRAEMRRHFQVVTELLEGKIGLAIEALQANLNRTHHHGVVLDEHERRITHRESRM